MKIPIKLLESKLKILLLKHFEPQEVEAIIKCLVWAEMSGIKSQGIIKLTGNNPLQNIKPKKPITILKDTILSQLIDGGAHPAQYVCQLAVDAAIAKAGQSGFAVVGVNNIYSSNCAQGYYVEQMARRQLIGICMSRSPGAIAPFGSRQKIFGTNPMAFAFPTTKDPFIFDAAMSAITWFDLLRAKNNHAKLPKNVAIDQSGNKTVDPSEALMGALLPFDNSYKSSGLAMIVEFIAGPLVGAAFCEKGTYQKDWGSIFFAIDPDLLVDRKIFMSQCQELVESVIAVDAPGAKIRLPGQRAAACRRLAIKKGVVDVEDAVLRQLKFI